MNSLHYPDIERCKKLQSLWMKWNIDILYVEWELLDYHTACKYHAFDSLETVCAFTVMEMLDVIPWAIEKNDWPRFFTIDKHSPIDNEPDHYDVWFMDETDTLLYSHTDTLPNALADLIFWLHENNYIKL